MNKKTSISIMIIIIILIIVSLVISIYMPNKEKIVEEIEDNSISYYLLKEEEKFGIINQNGDIVISPNYEEIIIPNVHKAVFICKNQNEQKILNNNNEEIYTKHKNIEPIELTNIISEYAYEKNVLKYEKDGKYGLIALSGKVILEPKYDEISSLGYKQGEILVKENGKYGIINDKGNQIIKCNYDSIISDQFYNETDGYKKSGYIVCNVTNQGYRYGYVDYEGSKVLETEYNHIMRLTKSDDKIYLIASKNGQFGVFINSNKIINTQYQSITYDSGIEMFIVERTGNYGAINEKGIEILKTEYSEIEINGIYMYTKKNEEQKIYDKTGKETEITPTTIIEATSNSEYYIKSEEEKYFILNSNLENISIGNYAYLEYLYNKYFIAINEEGKSGIIDANENIIIEFKYDLIQTIKGKNIIQARNFETNMTEIYNNELSKTLEIENVNIQNLEDYSKIYNEEEEYYLNNNGNKIEESKKLEEIKQSNAILRIGNYKRVTYGVEQYYYIKEN